MTKEGTIGCYHHHDRKLVAVVEVFCQTDFAAKNSILCDLAKNLAIQLAAMGPVDDDSLMNSQYVKEPNLTISDLVKDAKEKLGEEIEVGRFLIMRLGSSAVLFS